MPTDWGMIYDVSTLMIDPANGSQTRRDIRASWRETVWACWGRLGLRFWLGQFLPNAQNGPDISDALSHFKSL